MALFTVGGNFGVALGPILLGTFLAIGGRSGTVGWLAFALVFPPILYMAMRRVSAQAAPAAARATIDVAAEPTRRGALALLLAVIFFRQWTQTGLTTFIPLYFVTFLHEPTALANQLLSALLFGSVVGTLAGGPLADRFGRKPVLSVSLFLTVPLLLVFLRGGPGPLAPLVLFAAGTVMLSTASVVVVMGQELLPRSTGLAAGLTIGFASGLAGLGGVLLGGVADRFGVAETMALVCLLPLPGALLSLRLPDTLQRAPATSPTPA
jgi:FSR family fosmidomycin resistance protein-like MFS transporter